MERTLVALGHRWLSERAVDSLAFYWTRALERLPDTHLKRETRLPTGARLTVTLADYFHRHLYFSGVYEPATTRAVLSLLRPGDVFLDVGANAGYFSCLAAAHGAQVHAFEPNPALLKMLTRTQRRNSFRGTLVTNGEAVAAANGTADLRLSPDPWNTGLSSLLMLNDIDAGEAIPVATTTLDDYCRSHDIARIRLIKVDVEGAEMEVLVGSRHVLASIRPEAIICELGGFAGGADTAAVVRLLASYGYWPYRITESGALEAARGPGAADEEAGLPPNYCFLLERPVPGSRQA